MPTFTDAPRPGWQIRAAWNGFEPNPLMHGGSLLMASALLFTWRYYNEHGELPLELTEDDVHQLMSNFVISRGGNPASATTTSHDGTRTIGSPPVSMSPVSTDTLSGIAYTMCACGNHVITTGYYRPSGCSCEMCSECCECDRCSNCNRLLGDRSICDRCDNCSSCCECAHCSRCGDAVESTCSECDRCNQCCRCDEALRTCHEGRAWIPSLEARKHFRSERLAGIEWEFNEVENARAIRSWADQWRGGIHSDSSCGYECVTPPLGGDYIRECIGDLGRALAESGATADKSCSIHVHVNARDLFWPDIFRLMAIHAHLEPLLYVIAGQGRVKNSYCHPTHKVFRTVLERVDRKGAALSLVNDSESGYVNERDGRTNGRHGIHKKSGGRYRSLNLMPWLARQHKSRRNKDKLNSRAPDTTVEFRMHKNTLDGERAIEWTHLCVRIVDWVARASDADADRIIQKSALRALAEIAPESLSWVLKRIRLWRENCSPRRRMFGVREGKWVQRVA